MTSPAPVKQSDPADLALAALNRLEQQLDEEKKQAMAQLKEKMEVCQRQQMGREQIWENRRLTAEERSQFRARYKAEAWSKPLFMWMKRGKLTMTMWVIWVVLCCAFFLSFCSSPHALNDAKSNFRVSAALSHLKPSPNNRWANPSVLISISWQTILVRLSMMLLGILSLQVVFVTTHMEAHAMFLEYDAHRLNDSRINFDIVYWFAFYHHHHNSKDDWAPELSYHNPKGTNAVVSAHWYSYSLFSKFQRSVFTAFVCLCIPNMTWMLIGYELAVFLLPMAHGWQHIDRNRFGPLKPIISLLAKIGIIADRHDHEGHHQYDGPTVYKKFSSSGPHLVSIDQYLDKKWDEAFNLAKESHSKPYDILFQWTSRARFHALAAATSASLLLSALFL